MAAAGVLVAAIHRARAAAGARRYEAASRAVQRYTSALARTGHELALRTVLLVLALLVPAVVLLAWATDSPLRWVTAFAAEVVLLGAAAVGSETQERWVLRVDAVLSRTGAVVAVVCLLAIALLTLLVVAAAVSSAWSSVVGVLSMIIVFVLLVHACLDPVVGMRTPGSAQLATAVSAVGWAATFVVVVFGALALVQTRALPQDLGTAVGVAAASVVGAAMLGDLRRQRRLLTELVCAIDGVVVRISPTVTDVPDTRAAWWRLERALLTAFLGRSPARVVPLGDPAVIDALREYHQSLVGPGPGREPRSGRRREVVLALRTQLASRPADDVRDELVDFLTETRTRLMSWVDVAA